MRSLSLLIAAIALAALGLTLYRGYREQRRRQLLGRILDAADTLETRLRAARSELDTIGQPDTNPALLALRDVLRQRLWLQEHGPTASLRALDQIRRSLEAASNRIDEQLQQVERARTELATARAEADAEHRS